jgi:GAF domain-containing protein
MNATPDSTLADAEQRIADLERQLAEREAERDEFKAERDEALEQQTATAEVLQVINSSPGDLTPVFDAILENAHRLCGGVIGRLLIREGDEFHVVAAHGEAQWIEALRQQGRWRPREGAPLARLVSGERIVHIPDVREEDQYRNIPSYKRLIDAAGTRTMLMVPLRKDGALLGAITASRPEIRPFTDKQIALLENFAEQAVIAMENARLITEQREALEHQTATAAVLGVINSSPGDLTSVFDAILEKAHALCGVEYGALFLFDGEKFCAVVVRGYSEELEQSLRRPYSPQPSFVHALLHGEALVEIDPHQAEPPSPRAEAAIAIGIRRVLFLPLRRDNHLLGMITAHLAISRRSSMRCLRRLCGCAERRWEAYTAMMGSGSNLPLCAE